MEKKQVKKGTFSRFLKYLFSNYTPHLIVVIVCILISSLASVIANFYIQRIVDEVITPGLANGFDSVASQFSKILISMAVIYVFGVVAAFLTQESWQL